MGAWGHRALEDDTACDWIGAFRRGPALNLIDDALAAVLEAAFVDDLLAPRAMAAAEVVAALNRHPAGELPSEVAQWAASYLQANADLLERARRAVDRVFRESELRDIWEDAGSADKWAAAVQELLRRLAD